MSTPHHHGTRSLRVPMLITLFVRVGSLLALVSGEGTSPTAAAITPEAQQEHAPDLNTCGTATVRIMTWNIRYDNPDDGIHAWPRRRDELLFFVLSKNPDLLCMQERLHSQVEFLKDGMAGFDRRCHLSLALGEKLGC